MIIKTLCVGDPHVSVGDLSECIALRQYVMTIATQEKINKIIVLGDLFHTHQIVNLEVQKFWADTLTEWTNVTSVSEVVLLVGNHDKRVGVDLTDVHSLMMFCNVPGVTVIDKPRELFPGVLFLPHYTSHVEFLSACNSYANCDTVVCHQTFDGSSYENGFYAKDGIDANLIPQKQIISGHIHSGQEHGKVWYPGSPRWRTLGDANCNRAIWLVEFEDGRMVSRTPFDTSPACKVIYQLRDEPTAQATVPNLKDGDVVVVDVHGPEDYVRARKVELEKLNVKRIRTFPVRAKDPVVRESEGIKKAFSKYTEAFRPKNGTSPERLLDLVKERVTWMRT